MHKRIFLFLLLALSAASAGAQAGQRQRVAVFTPLYLDSVFDASYNYRYDKTFPKFLNPGLEFYQGVQLALDSLEVRGAPLEVFILDSRSRRTPLARQLTNLRDLDMIIGQTNAAETRLLAEEALRRKIPFISASLPNDAGVGNNPYMVVLNSTLPTHAESIYRYLQRRHPSDPIVYFRKPGAQEDALQKQFAELQQRSPSPALRIRFVTTGAQPSAGALAAALDSTRRTVCIAGSLDESFGRSLAASLEELNEDYPVTLFGMPTWDNFNFGSAPLKNLDVFYTTPFFYQRHSGLSGKLSDEFTERISGRPTDMFFRGYEVMLRFGLLLLDTKEEVGSSLSRKGNTIFTPFDIQPTFSGSPDSPTLDYFENKKVYVVRASGGVKTLVE